MRTAAKAKLGYYPTPPDTLALLLTWLTADPPGYRRFLDPCVGEGEALAALAHHHTGEAYGIELSQPRAEIARGVLHKVLCTGFENAVLTEETFSLLLLNPPYDTDALWRGDRMEESFLIRATKFLVQQGVLIYLLPHPQITERLARHLAGWFQALRAFKLPEGEYEVFKQIVVFGVRKTHYTTPTQEAMEHILAWKTGQRRSSAALVQPLPYLGAAETPYPIPVTPLRGKGGKAFRFQYTAVSDEALVREGLEALGRLEQTSAWRDLRPVTEPPTLRPLMTPKRGHIASQLSGGLLGSNLVATHEGGLLLIKGGQHKKTVVAKLATTFEAEDEDPDKEKLRRVELDEQFETVLTTLDEAGMLSKTTDPQRIAALIEQHVEALAAVVLARNIPQYSMDPKAWEWAALDPLSTSRHLPGRMETGLTDFQRHLTIAHGRDLLKTGANILMAEMGAGKTTVGLAVAEYLQAAVCRGTARRSPYPALVVGPGIVTGEENWPKEVAEVIPEAGTRIVTLGAKPHAKPQKIRDWLQETLGLCFDTDSFEGLNAPACLGRLFLLAKKRGTPVGQRTWVALEDSLQRAERNPPPRHKHARAANLLDGRIGGFLWLGFPVPRDRNHLREIQGQYSLAQFVAEYRTRQLPEKSFAILSYETAKLGPGRTAAMRTKKIRLDKQEAVEFDPARGSLVAVCTCPGCGRVVAEAYDRESGEPFPDKIITPQKAENWVQMRRRFCQAPVTRWVWSEEEGSRMLANRDMHGSPFVCGTPLFENGKLRRVAAAEYARRKAKDFFGLLQIDELHQAKAKGTGVAWTLTALHSASRYTLGLTGTLFGGYSTSIFWLFFRLFPEIRAQFAFNDEQRWASKYGLLKTIFYVDQQVEIPEDGTYTGRRFLETVREKPGIGSAIIGQALERATFSSLQDIGLPLPPYREAIVRLPLSPEMEALLPEVDGSQTDPPTGLLAWAFARMEEDDGKGAISVWLNTALAWPNAAFRDRMITFTTSQRDLHTLAKIRRTEHVREFAGLSGWLPKETWLAETCQHERRAGRKTLVYLRQTGEQDIQPRLVEVLEAHGLRVGVLKPAIAPRQRATWIKRHVHKFDVLLTNARLIQVGLNLTSFSTGVFYELDLSLYVAWQAMRRLYRPGQLQPVQMLFPVYENTMEARMVDLMGNKMLAAQVFYGDDVGGALVEEGADADLLGELVRAALGQVQIGRAEGFFRISESAGTQPVVQPPPNGSGLLPSPPPDPRLSFVISDPTLRQQLTGQKQRAKGKKATNGQLSLFD